MISRRVKALVAIGESGPQIRSAAAGVTAVEAGSMEEAVRRARELAADRRRRAALAGLRVVRHVRVGRRSRRSASARRSQRSGSPLVHNAAAVAAPRDPARQSGARSYVNAPLDVVALHRGRGARRDRSGDGVLGVERDGVRRARRHRLLSQTPTDLARPRTRRRVRVLSHRVPPSARRRAVPLARRDGADWCWSSFRTSAWASTADGAGSARRG